MLQERKRLSTLASALCVVALAAPGTAARGDVSGYRFIIPDVDTAPGEALRLTVKAEYESPAQGFVFAATYPADAVTVGRVHADDTILESIDTDFFEATVSPGEGFLVVSALVDSLPPFEGQLIPNLGFAIDLFHVEMRAREDAGGLFSIRTEDGLSSPPVTNVFSVDNQSVPITDPGVGTIFIDDGSGNSGRPLPFIRGDADLNGDVTIVDPIRVLDHAFIGSVELECLQAADANDDDRVDVSDAVAMLAFLFNGGAAPPSPFRFPGRDPTPGELGCRRGLPDDV